MKTLRLALDDVDHRATTGGQCMNWDGIVWDGEFPTFGVYPEKD